MLPYYLLIGSSLAGWPLLERRPNYKRGFLLTAGFTCWLLASLRYVIGFDYRFYESIFQMIADTGFSGFTELNWAEPGYLLLNLAVACLGGDYRTFLFVFHFLFTLSVFIWMGRYSSSPWMSVFLFLTLQYFALSMNFLRQALAAAVILWIYPFIKKRRILPCLGLVLLAMCFHRTALVMLPLCFLLTLRPSKYHYGLAALAAGGLYFFMDPLVQVAVKLLPQYQHYLTEKYWQGNSFIYLRLPLGSFFFALPLLRQAIQKPSVSPFLANSMFYATLLQVFITKHFILERFSIYAAFFSLLALPEAVNISEGRTAKLRTALLAAGGIIYFLFAANNGFHGVYPYRGVWDRVFIP